MTSVKQLDPLIGRTGKLDIGNAPQPCFVSVEIVDARKVWDKIHVACQPLVGAGFVWKNLENVRLDDEPLQKGGTV